MHRDPDAERAQAVEPRERRVARRGMDPVAVAQKEVCQMGAVLAGAPTINATRSLMRGPSDAG